MARPHSDHPHHVQQLTLDDWEEMLSAIVEQPADKLSHGASAVAVLADALAPRIAQELSVRLPTSSGRGGASPPLLTLDQLVAELPAAKLPQTWKRWLYERTRRGEIPGCIKLGGTLFFEREPALAWLRAGATSAK